MTEKTMAEMLSEEETRIDPDMGYPLGFAKLCRYHSLFQGPPSCFLPYAQTQYNIMRSREFEALFPEVVVKAMINDEIDLEFADKKYAEFLWQQLDHLGGAGFDPAKFRVDCYGNVLYWNADPDSPLSWSIDHWFPCSRGGKTIAPNLRVIQWQSKEAKGGRLEFLVPWWELQMGVSVTQFLSAFASRNRGFSQRAFSFFFLEGENEEIDEKQFVGWHNWPHHFLEKKSRVGLAAAAVVKVHKDIDHHNLRNMNETKPRRTPGKTSLGQHIKNQRSAMEWEKKLFVSGSSNENCEPTRSSIAQNKDKRLFVSGSSNGNCETTRNSIDLTKDEVKDRLMKQASKKNREHISNAAKVHNEEKLKRIQDDERRQRKEVVLELEKELKMLGERNESKARLSKQRKSFVEKKKQLPRNQTQYRPCLDKEILDKVVTHRIADGKFEGALNESPCPSLFASVGSRKSSDCSENDLERKRNQDDDHLETLKLQKIIDYFGREEEKAKCNRKPSIAGREVHRNLNSSEVENATWENGRELDCRSRLNSLQVELQNLRETEIAGKAQPINGNLHQKLSENGGLAPKASLHRNNAPKCKSLSEADILFSSYESFGGGLNADKCKEGDGDMAGQNGEEDRISRVNSLLRGYEREKIAIPSPNTHSAKKTTGKSTVDKWLNMFLSNTPNIDGEENVDEKMSDFNNIARASYVNKGVNKENPAKEEKRKGIIGGLLRRLSSKHQALTPLEEEKEKEKEKRKFHINSVKYHGDYSQKENLKPGSHEQLDQLHPALLERFRNPQQGSSKNPKPGFESRGSKFEVEPLKESKKQQKIEEESNFSSDGEKVRRSESVRFMGVSSSLMNPCPISEKQPKICRSSSLRLGSVRCYSNRKNDDYRFMEGSGDAFFLHHLSEEEAEEEEEKEEFYQDSLEAMKDQAKSIANSSKSTNSKAWKKVSKGDSGNLPILHNVPPFIVPNQC